MRLSDGIAMIVLGDFPDWVSDEEFLDTIENHFGTKDSDAIFAQYKRGMRVPGVDNFRVEIYGH